MKRIVLGMLAHVDAGKTTTAEALLYAGGKIRTPGRVDHKDAYLDSHRLERERGITIFSKQAVFEYGGCCFTLLDTPGHTDFSSEMERTLSVMDYALLIISAPDGVQAHTLTVWELLKRYNVPTLIWINKEDLLEKTLVSDSADARSEARKKLISDIGKRLGCELSDFSSDPLASEEVASLDLDAAEEFIGNGRLSEQTVARMIAERRIFPAWFGSSLKLEGTKELLDGLCRWTMDFSAAGDFSGRVFKITRDSQGNRLTWIKVVTGSVRPRELIGEEKVLQVRRYSGDRFTALDEALPGEIAALTGLQRTYAGQGLGSLGEAKDPELTPVLSYTVIPEDGTDAALAYRKLKVLADEDPQLGISWNEQLQRTEIRLMGEIQTEVIKQVIKDRFDLDVSISQGRILYRETVAAPAEGIGHFEPLRHYAEVRLLIEPLPFGSGLVFDSAVSTDDLALNWQRLILYNLAEKKHIGVLTGAPLTDVKITVTGGRAHLKHTEGGDFRQAALRAVRCALMNAENVLLEPFYDFRIEVPSDCIGRVISDVKAMQASFSPADDIGGSMVLSGRAPAEKMQDYQPRLMAASRGLGKLSVKFAGYYPCAEAERVIKETGYDPESDVENTPDSVFCSHGAGVNVKWSRVSELIEKTERAEDAPLRAGGRVTVDDALLEEIMLREFGPIKRPRYTAPSYDYSASRPSASSARRNYLIVDGYNMIYSWKELRELSSEDMELAREKLSYMLGVYGSLRNSDVVLVFDGYAKKENPGEKSGENGLRTVFTKEGESADFYIEKLIHEVGKNYSVRVATSDGMIQLAALRLGVIRVSARELEAEVGSAVREAGDLVSESNRRQSFSNHPRILGEEKD